jgi:hypothetical protein
MPDTTTALSMAMHLLKKQVDDGPLTGEEREMLASLLTIIAKTKPCKHCGKDPYDHAE